MRHIRIDVPNVLGNTHSYTLNPLPCKSCPSALIFAKKRFESDSTTNSPASAKIMFEDESPRKILPRRVPVGFHTCRGIVRTRRWEVERIGKTRQKQHTLTPSPHPEYTFPFLSSCMPSGMPVSAYANTRRLVNVSEVGSTSN